MSGTRVLFVCSGNICRSPTAEGVFRALATDEGWPAAVLADSAGTNDYHIGDPPDPRAIAHAAGRGIDIAALRARQVAPEDFGRFDLIVAMDRGHARQLEALRRRHAGPHTAEIVLLLDFVEDKEGRDVPDPYYGGEREFARALDLIERGVAGLVAHLRRD
ncbi:MAG: low molecular weight protein-tyrosine-phosphatase [Azospirillaceae bacterium]